MVLFSLIFTPWVIGRRNSLLPLLAHFVIEVELVIFQLLV